MRILQCFITLIQTLVKDNIFTNITKIFREKSLELTITKAFENLS